jgi:hypothetical protein
MTVKFWPLPQIEAKTTAPKPKKKPARGFSSECSNSPRKYDHEAMLRDRMTGMKWREVASKHGIGSGDSAYRLCMHSNAIKRLTPEQVAQL